MVHTFTILGRPMSTTNSQQIIQIPIKGSEAPRIPDLLCPKCSHVVTPAHLGERPKRAAILRSSAALKWQKEAVKQLKAQHRGAATIEGDVAVHMTVFRALNAGDADNYIKGMLDAIAEAGILRDDRQVITVSATKRVDKDNPRYEVTVEELPGQGMLFGLTTNDDEA